jgi:hypothetical protein
MIKGNVAWIYGSAIGVALGLCRTTGRWSLVAGFSVRVNEVSVIDDEDVGSIGGGARLKSRIAAKAN